MADNTCHFGINSFFADNGLADTQSWLYFPADAAQMTAVVKRVFFDKGIRFVFSTRSKVPWILKEDGSRYFDENYEFVPGKDEVIAEGTAGYVVSYGDMLYRSWDAVLRCRQEGLDVGLINKPTLNLVDEQTIRKIGSSHFVLVVESLNQKTGVSITEIRRSIAMLINICSAARLEVRYLATRAWPHSSLWLHGHQQGGLRWSHRADSPPRARPSVYVISTLLICRASHPDCPLL